MERNSYGGRKGIRRINMYTGRALSHSFSYVRACEHCYKKNNFVISVCLTQV